MPAMIRPPSKVTKIAYRIVGIPANMIIKRNKRLRTRNKRLLFEETMRVRGAY